MRVRVLQAALLSLLCGIPANSVLAHDWQAVGWTNWHDANGLHIAAAAGGGKTKRLAIKDAVAKSSVASGRQCHRAYTVTPFNFISVGRMPDGSDASVGTGTS